MKNVNKQLFYVICMGLSVFLSGCASIVDGTKQTISVQTFPSGANCVLSNDKGKWFVSDTPGSVVVHQSTRPLEVVCQKASYVSSDVSDNSTIKPMIFGNILFGGVIGLVIDDVDGAGFAYPSIVSVPLREVSRKN